MSDTQFKIGDRVKIVSITYEGADVEIGDSGVIVEISNDEVYLDIAGKHDNWMCKVKDIALPTDRDRELIADNLLRDATRRLTQQYITLNSKITELCRQEVINISNSISNKYNEIAQLIINLRNISKLQECNMRRCQRINDEDEAFNFIKSLLTNKYDAITFNGLEVKATTKPITIATRVGEKDTKQTQIPMGRFIVVINIATNKINIRNEKDTYMRGHCVHPHITTDIDGNSGICWGTWDKSIYDALKNYDYLLVLSICYKFLSQCDMNSPYMHIAHWTNFDDRCERCFEYLDNCHCEDEDRCEYCDNHIDDCSCDRCPSSDEVVSNGIPDDYCINECRHWVRDDDDSDARCNLM